MRLSYIGITSVFQTDKESSIPSRRTTGCLSTTCELTLITTSFTQGRGTTEDPSVGCTMHRKNSRTTFVAQWIERFASDEEVGGSIPSKRTISILGVLDSIGRKALPTL